jgi:hypothetical protein
MKMMTMATMVMVIIIIIIIIISTTRMECEMYDYTSNNWGHWNNNRRLKKNLQAIPGRRSID